MNRSKRLIGLCVASLILLLAARPAMADGSDAAKTILDQQCGKCHERTADGTLNRIGEIREIADGWALTIRRMREWHHITVSEDEERVLVKYLADTQGLAPEETAPYRAVLERRPGIVETADDPDIKVFCARCHTYARVGLQHRDTAEWVKLVHGHVGQFPTLEYQESARNREWFKLATTVIAAKLGEKWPFSTTAWSQWKTHQPADLSGSWRVVGHRPGKGDYSGSLTATKSGQDEYTLRYSLAYADGSKLAGSGHAILYTGFVWRGTSQLGKERVNEVYEVSADGNHISGRWFLADNDGVGGDLRAVRAGTPELLAVQPPYIKAGQSTRLTLVGSGLSGSPDLGPGVRIEKVITSSAEGATVIATADNSAAGGLRPVAVGQSKLADGLVVYDKVDTVAVEPPYTIARTGANGGPVATVPAQFEAVAFMRGPAGPMRIGVMPANWSLAPFDTAAGEADDVRFAGKMGQDGLFRPAGAGPNRARHGGNNVGNLTIKAVVADGPVKLQGTGHLIVTVQRWNDAVIR